MNVASSLKIARAISALLAIILLLAGLLALSGCEDSKRDDVDLEEQQTLYLLFTNPTDATDSCTAAMTEALACAGEAGTVQVNGFPYPATDYYTGLLQTLYSITIESPGGAGEICSALLPSPNYPVPGGSDMEYTAGARVCFFDCDRQFWEKMQNKHQDQAANRCTSDEFASLSPIDDPDHEQCLEDCFSQGTIFVF